MHTAGPERSACCKLCPHRHSLAGGAVLLHNPDGSVQYVVLTSDEQKAVQLKMQARQDQSTKGDTDVDAYQVSSMCREKRSLGLIAP